MCHKIGLSPIWIRGLGLKSVSLSNRLPFPPHNITVFIVFLLSHLRTTLILIGISCAISVLQVASASRWVYRSLPSQYLSRPNHHIVRKKTGVYLCIAALLRNIVLSSQIQCSWNLSGVYYKTPGNSAVTLGFDVSCGGTKSPCFAEEEEKWRKRGII